MKSLCVLCLLLIIELILSGQEPNTTFSPGSGCIACEQITLFARTKHLAGDRIWNGLNSLSYTRPLLYFTDSNTYAAFAAPGLFAGHVLDTIDCNKGLSLLKMKRLDAQPFHRENKMSFADTASLFYRQPMMLCSDVETMHRFVPDFNRTEDWLLLHRPDHF